MIVNFKAERLFKEWQDLLLKNPKLVYIVLFAAEKLGDIVITGIYRTQEEQEKIYGAGYKIKSVHQYWRGVDIRIPAKYDSDRINYLIDMINEFFPYGKKGYETVIRHEVERDGVKFGDHLHIQTRGI